MNNSNVEARFKRLARTLKKAKRVKSLIAGSQDETRQHQIKSWLALPNERQSEQAWADLAEQAALAKMRDRLTLSSAKTAAEIVTERLADLDAINYFEVAPSHIDARVKEVVRIVLDHATDDLGIATLEVKFFEPETASDIEFRAEFGSEDDFEGFRGHPQLLGQAQGNALKGTIWIRKGLTLTQTVDTCAHEMGHLLFGHDSEAKAREYGESWVKANPGVEDYFSKSVDYWTDEATRLLDREIRPGVDPALGFDPNAPQRPRNLFDPNEGRWLGDGSVRTGDYG